MKNIKIIKTHYMHMPIPISDFDWLAFYDGEEEEGDKGWGKTEQDAIINLIKQGNFK